MAINNHTSENSALSVVNGFDLMGICFTDDIRNEKKGLEDKSLKCLSEAGQLTLSPSIP